MKTLPILLLASLLPAAAQTLFAGHQAAVSTSSSAAPYVYPSSVIAAFTSTGSGSFSNADGGPGFPDAKLAELGLAVYHPPL